MSSFPSYHEFGIGLLSTWPTPWRLDTRRLGKVEVQVVENVALSNGENANLVNVLPLLPLFQFPNIHEYFEAISLLPADPRFYYFRPSEAPDIGIPEEVCLISWREFFSHVFLFPAFRASRLELPRSSDSNEVELPIVQLQKYVISSSMTIIQRPTENKLRKGFATLSKAFMEKMADNPSSPILSSSASLPTPPTSASTSPTSHSMSSISSSSSSSSSTVSSSSSSIRRWFGGIGDAQRESRKAPSDRFSVDDMAPPTDRDVALSISSTSLHQVSLDAKPLPMHDHNDELRRSGSLYKLPTKMSLTMNRLPLEELVQMVRTNDLGGIREQLTFVDVNSVLIPNTNRSLLMVAAEEGYLEMTQELLHAGALVNQQDNHGWTALHFAANQSQLSICHRLLMKGANPLLMTSSGNTALHYLASKGHIGIEDPYVYIALFMVILQKYPGIANIQNYRGETAAHRACMYGGKQSLIFFSKFASVDLSIKTIKGEDLMLYAVRSSGNSLPLIHFLLNQPNTTWDLTKAIDTARMNQLPELVEVLQSHQGIHPSAPPSSSASGKALKRRVDQRIRLTIDRDDTVIFSSPCQREILESNLQAAGRMFQTKRGVGFCSVAGDEPVITMGFETILSIEPWTSLSNDPGIRILSQSQQLIFVGLLHVDTALQALNLAWKQVTPLPKFDHPQLLVDQQLLVDIQLSQQFSQQLKAALSNGPYGFFAPKPLVPSTINEALLEQSWEASGYLITPTAVDAAQLQQLVEHGVPTKYRAKIWLQLTGAIDKKGSAAPGYWADLSERTRMQSDTPHQIEIDLSRTFPNHPLFSSPEGETPAGLLLPGIAALRHVLVAYSLRDSRVGYCQSMNYIAGMLLVLLDGDVEGAFWSLCGIVENVVPDYYTGSMRASMVDQEVFDMLISLELSELTTWWEKNEIDWNFLKYATVFPWFLCLFSHGGNVLPIDTLIWVWDNLFLHGSVFLFEVALTILKLALPSLLWQSTPELAKTTIIKFAAQLNDRQSLAAAVVQTRASLRKRHIDIPALRLKYCFAACPPHFQPRSRKPMKIRSSSVSVASIFEVFSKYATKSPHSLSKSIDLDSFVQSLLCLWASTIQGFTSTNDYLIEIFHLIDLDRNQSISLLQYLIGSLFFVFSHDTPSEALDFVYQLLTHRDPLTAPVLERFLSIVSAIVHQNEQFIPIQPLGSHRSLDLSSPNANAHPSIKSLSLEEFWLALEPYPKLITHLQNIDQIENNHPM